MQNSESTQRHIISVSQLNRRARQLLETHMPLLWIEGEMSNFARPSSGHWYFTLKDDTAQIKCAMFRNRNTRVQHHPQQGQQVLVRGRVSLYEGRGDYQLIVEHMEEAGHGALQRAFDELKLKLHREGLFDDHRKQTLPSLPRHIGVITSPTGAAIRDILHVLERRFPSIPVSVFPVVVQGQTAAPQISRAIGLANTTNCDLLIVGRGGGSLEDLWAFNEESVARAIAASQIPIVSAVGHEVDFTISDFVADVRAPTPSAAAEICTPDANDMRQQYKGYEVLLEEALTRKLQRMYERLLNLKQRLQHPGKRLQDQAQHLDTLEMRLMRAINQQLVLKRNRLEQLQLRHAGLSPKTHVQNLQNRIRHLDETLQRTMKQTLSTRQQHLSQAMAVLNSVSPLQTMERGYSISRDSEHKVLRSCDQVRVGDLISTHLSTGKIISRVESKES